MPSKPQDLPAQTQPSQSSLGGAGGEETQCRNLLCSVAAGAIIQCWNPAQPQVPFLRHPAPCVQLKLASWLSSRNKVDEQIYLSFSFVSQRNKGGLSCLHIEANYQYIEMWIFSLKLQCFLNTRTAQSSFIFIKRPLHVFRVHFNETSTSISYIFFLVQPVWLQDNIYSACVSAA